MRNKKEKKIWQQNNTANCLNIFLETITHFLKALNTKPNYKPHAENLWLFWQNQTITSKPFYLLKIKQCLQIIHTSQYYNTSHYIKKWRTQSPKHAVTEKMYKCEQFWVMCNRWHCVVVFNFCLSVFRVLHKKKKRVH